MKEYKFAGVDESLYYDKLVSGLEIFLCPNKNIKSFFITYNVKFGSTDTEFKVKGEKKFHKVPNGIAHFLEHLMFCEPDGTTAHEKFDQLGSSCNAATSFYTTYYEVSGVKKFKENLEYLIDYVDQPYFTKENTKNEKGIIIEEINMGKSSPYHELFFGNKKNLYQKSNLKYLVTGEKEDIEKIKVEDLQLCYDTFYQPSNMFIIITGNFNPLEARTIIKENQSKKNHYQNSIIRHKIVEPLTVNKDYEEKIMNVEIPKLTISFKLPINNLLHKGLSKSELLLYLNLYLSLKYSETSLFTEELMKNNLIVEGIEYYCSINDGIVAISLTTDTLYPNEIESMIKNEFKKLDFSTLDLFRKSKVEISDFILRFDDIYAVNEYLQYQLFIEDKINYSIYNILNNISLTKFKEVVSLLEFKNYSTYVILPNKKPQ